MGFWRLNVRNQGLGCQREVARTWESGLGFRVTSCDLVDGCDAGNLRLLAEIACGSENTGMRAWGVACFITSGEL